MKVIYPCDHCSRKDNCDARNCESWKQWFCTGWEETVKRLRERLGA